ncbi:hypothetical protein GIY23_07770 [Allosaccharopolyspora coralli]|uniref:Uncharacterized protein n=1 Tax=Allosaccharopolyspora coralli TaxID=2665642 RepID=A0A5Q3QD71_9PSEU|nr:hypothetical protein [Allosaccharopolyspora coralli]QGK69435.1 hypothetical protein GIY23_07770 [Allosaccharopolyspora coralli]
MSTHCLDAPRRDAPPRRCPTQGARPGLGPGGRAPYRGAQRHGNSGAGI